MTKRAAGRKPARVELQLAGKVAGERRREPVTSGVPWPRGALHVDDGLSLRDARGRRQPLQARALAYWPDGSVKWTLLTTRVDAHRGHTARFTLARDDGAGAAPVIDRNRPQSTAIDRGRDGTAAPCYDTLATRRSPASPRTGARGAPPTATAAAAGFAAGDAKSIEGSGEGAPLPGGVAGAEPLVMRRTTDGLRIDTGVMRLTVATTDGGLIRDLQVRDAKGRWRQMLQPGGLRLYVTRCAPDGSARVTFTNGPDTGTDRRSQPLPPQGFETSAEDPVYSVSVSEDGPERVGLRIAGTHVDGNGQRFCPYILNLYAYRDSTRLDLQHTLVYTGLPTTDLIAGFGLSLPLRLDPTGAAAVVPDDDGAAWRTEVQATPAHPRWVHTRLTQLLADGYRFEKWTGPDCGHLKMFEGRRHPGWAHLGSDTGGCLAGVRDFWQQYPKAFSTDADSGTLTVELWPETAGPWDLRRYSQNFHPDLYEYSRPDLWKQFPEATHGARGIAKTHDLSFVFHAGPQSMAALERLGQALVQPLFLMATPEWYCGSGALGTVAPAAPETYPKPEAMADACLDFMLAEQERCRWYGMVDYGDFQMTHAREDYNAPRDLPEANVSRWLADVGGHAWVNTEARPDQWLWLSFFRTGRADCLRAAMAMTRHNRDIDVYHWGNFKGSGSRHNVNHWGCADKEWRISMPISMRWQHYLTGDAWTRETITDAIATYQQYRDITTAYAPSGTAALCGLLVKAELNGSPEDFTVVRNLADVYARGVLPSGAFARQIHADLVTGLGDIPNAKDMGDRMFFLLGFGAMQTIVEAAELLDHRPLLAALVRHARARVTGALTAGITPPGKARAGDWMYLHLYALAWRQTRDLLFRRRITAELRHLKAPLVLQRRLIAGRPVGAERVPIAGRKQLCYFGDIGMELAFGLAALG